MLGLLGFLEIQEMTFCEAVIPTAVPCGERVGVLLERSGELGAGQRLDVRKSVSVDVCAQRRLSAGGRANSRYHESRCR